jgi:transcriptional regulator with XRE-family HTH domain
MARAALGLGVRELAERAKVSPDTVARLERGEELKERTVDAIRAALEAGGVEFVDKDMLGGPGVRLASWYFEAAEPALKRGLIPPRVAESSDLFVRLISADRRFQIIIDVDSAAIDGNLNRKYTNEQRREIVENNLDIITQIVADQYSTKSYRSENIEGTKRLHILIGKPQLAERDLVEPWNARFDPDFNSD